MKPPYFKRRGICFVPVRSPGWVLLGIFLAYAVYAFIDIDRRSHSISDTLMNFVFNLILIGIAYSFTAWILGAISTRKKEV